MKTCLRNHHLRGAAVAEREVTKPMNKWLEEKKPGTHALWVCSPLSCLALSVPSLHYLHVVTLMSHHSLLLVYVHRHS